MIQQVDPLTYRDWNEHVLSSPQGSIFHSTHWLQVLQASYGYQNYYLACFKNKQLTALLPFMHIKSWVTGVRGVSLPFSDYCAPMSEASISSTEMLTHVMPVARQQQWQYWEVRGEAPWLQGMPPYTSYQRHLLALDRSEEALFSRLRSNYRAKIRKAQANGLSVAMLRSPDAMDEYYRLHCATRKRQGVPPQPAYFFRYIHEYLIAKHMGFITLVSYRGQVIAGAIFFVFGGHALYKFGASATAYQQVYPNYVLFWHTIQWLCRQGYVDLCFGRTAPEHSGLIQFKEGWGAQSSKIHYYRYSLKTSSFLQHVQRGADLGAKICHKMPMPLLQFAGALFYKHVG